ncbi:hypothetical protein ACWDV7_23200 [Streptomyces sp. NPDC003362]
MAPYLTQHLLVQGGTSTPDVSLPPGTRRNADTLRKALLDPDTLAVRPEDCRTIVPESPHDVLSQLSEASASDGPLFVYWTGHGRLTDGGALQLALARDRFDDEPPRWIGARELVTAMRASGGPGRDRLLVLDTCLGGRRGGDEVPYSTAAIHREMEYLGRSSGVAVLSSVGPSPAAFAANHHAPSVFTQQLTELLRSPRLAGQGQGLDLRRLHELLYAALKGSGYLPPLLCNASGFRLPLTRAGLRPPAAYGLARRRPSEVAPVSSRYALTVAGALHAAWAESDTGPDYDPGLAAAWVHRRLLDSFCGFTPASASLLRTAPSRDELLNRVAELALEGRNLLLVYVAAHATARTADSGRLDLHLQLADDETVSVTDLVERLRQARAEQVVVLVDACRTGSDAGAAWQVVSQGGQRPFHALRPGFSRLVVQWFNSRQGESVHLPAHGAGAFADETLPGTDPDPEPGVTPWSAYTAWAFTFRGATITYDDSQGPLKDWLEFLRLGSDSERGRRAPLPSLTDSLFEAATRAAAEPAHEPAPEPTPERDDTDEAARSSGGGRRGSGSFRRHRARLRVTDAVLPARVGRTLQVVFDYTPMDDAWTPRPGLDATRTAPLKLTLRIRADSAEVRPAVIHTSLTDADGTPAERFEVTPQGEGPVRLRISVLRSADGTVIQQVSSVLPVAEGDGAVVSS